MMHEDEELMKTSSRYSKDHPERLQASVASAPKYREACQQHSTPRQSSSSHFLQTENRTLVAPLPRQKTENLTQTDSCSTGPQSPNNILKSCPNFNTLIHQTQLSPADAHRKLWRLTEKCSRLPTSPHQQD